MTQRPRREPIRTEGKTNVNVILMILCYSQIGALPNYHQRGFTQQLVGTDAETHSQALGRALEILLKLRKKDFWNQRGQGHHKKIQNQLTWTNRVSQSLKWQPGYLHGPDLGPLHVWDSCVVWSSCWIPNSGSKGSDSFPGFWDPTPHTVLLSQK